MLCARTATAVMLAALVLGVLHAQAEERSTDEILPETSLLQGDASKIADAGMGGVEHIIPKFQTGKEWAAASESRRAGYNSVNQYYKKTHEKAYKAQGAKREKLNEKADKALTKLKAAKEKIQKKYADDNPIDNGEGPMTSADKANAKFHKKMKDTESYTMGASGVPGVLKKYSDGVIASDSYRGDKSGHYYLGAHRRRIGAGFARRRTPAEVVSAKVTNKSVMKKAEKGHDLLKSGLGKPKHDHSEKDPILKNKEADAAHAAAVAEDDKKDAEKKKKLPPGVSVADKSNMTPETAAELKASGAGVDAEVDKTAHFTPETDEKIVGDDATDALTGGEKKN